MQCFNTGGRRVLGPVEEDANVKSYNVTGLHIATTYACYVACSTKIGLGPYSEVKFSTFYGQCFRYVSIFHLSNTKDNATPSKITLVTAAAFNRSNSTFGGSDTEMEKVSINSKDAARLSIQTGDKVKLHNEKGVVILLAEVSDKVAAGVLFSPKGAWCETSPTGQTVNALIDSHCKTDIGNGAAFYDTYVDISLI